MKLPLTLEVLGATQNELKSLGSKLPKAGALEIKPLKDSLLFWRWKGFEITGIEIPDDTNPKSDYWNLNQETRKQLIKLLEDFRQICPRIFSLYSALGGELPKRESDLRMTELLEVLAEGRIGNRVTYRVRELPPPILEEAASGNESPN